MSVLVDPPSGWLYGFPAPLEDDYEGQLRRAGYPVKDIPFALEHSRFIGKREDLDRAREIRGQRAQTPETELPA